MTQDLRRTKKSLNEDVGNQTRKRRGDGVGVWVLAARLEKVGTSLPRPRGGTGHFPTRSTQRTRPARHLAPPPITHHPTRCVWGGGYRATPLKIGLSLAKFFFAHSWSKLFFGTGPEGPELEG